jgi:hypothetical protein
MPHPPSRRLSSSSILTLRQQLWREELGRRQLPRQMANVPELAWRRVVDQVEPMRMSWWEMIMIAGGIAPVERPSRW